MRRCVQTFDWYPTYRCQQHIQYIGCVHIAGTSICFSNLKDIVSTLLSARDQVGDVSNTCMINPSHFRPSGFEDPDMSSKSMQTEMHLWKSDLNRVSNHLLFVTGVGFFVVQTS